MAKEHISPPGRARELIATAPAARTMIIVKCNYLLDTASHDKLWRHLVSMAESGVIVLTPGLELLNEVPADAEISIVKEN